MNQPKESIVCAHIPRILPPISLISRCIFQLYMYYIFSGSLNILVDVQNQYLYFYQLMQNGGRFWLVGFMVFNATFNNPSLISWRSVLLVEETRVARENHITVASHGQTLAHNVV